MLTCFNRRLKLTISFLFLFLTSFSQQVDTSFVLLWYKGKKVNDTILITPGGNTITFSPAKGQAGVTFAPKKNLLEHYIRQLKKNEQRKQELDQVVIRSPRGPLKVGLIYQINQAMDEVAQTSQDLTENKITVTDKSPEIASSLYSETQGLPVWVENYYRDIKAYLFNISKETEFDPPAPPSLDFDYCYVCDSSRQASYKKQGEDFENTYLKEEKEYLKKIAELLHYFTFRDAQKFAYDTIAGKRIREEMIAAMITIVQHMEQKLLAAWNLYKNDASKAPFISNRIVEMIHYALLLGLDPGSRLPGLHEMASQMTKVAIKRWDDAVKERDYKVMLNVRWFVNIFRAAELMELDSDQFEHGVLDFANACQFKITVNADANMGGSGTISAAKITGENIFSAIPDSNCILKWRLLAPDSAKMKFDLEKAVLESQGQKATYAGTKVWASQAANLKLDFCKADKDTAIFAGFFATQGQEEWIMPAMGKSTMQFIPTIYMTCFMDKKRIEEMARMNKSEMEKTIREMKEQYQKHIASNQQLMGKDPSKMTPQELQKMNEMMMASSNIENMIQRPAVNNFILKERLKNNLKTVFEKSLNGKELFPENKAILNALFKVAIVHEE